MKIKKVLNLFLIILSLFLVAPNVLAVNLLPPGCTSTAGCSLCDFVTLFINGANILLGLSGTFAILMFVYGGITMITAYGNEARVKWGRDILISTVTGIVIVLFAWTFINLIIGALLGKSNFDWANSNGVCNGQQGGGGLNQEQRDQINSLGPL